MYRRPLSLQICIQLFQLTLSDQSVKLEDKTARLCGIFFLNKFMKTSLPRPYSEDLWWRAIWMKEIPGYQVDEEAAVSRMASLEVRPYCRTRKHQWALSRSCVNWSVNLSSDEGDTNKDITWKYRIILFVLLFSITLTCLTSTEIANYPVTKLIGVKLKLRKLNDIFAVMRSCSQQHLEFGHLHFDVLQRMATKCNKI